MDTTMIKLYISHGILVYTHSALHTLTLSRTQLLPLLATVLPSGVFP